VWWTRDAHHMGAGKQGGGGKVRTRRSLGQAPSDVLPPDRPPFMFSAPPKIASAAGDHALAQELVGHFIFK
jgi:hypothetical protein